MFASSAKSSLEFLILSTLEISTELQAACNMIGKQGRVGNHNFTTVFLVCTNGTGHTPHVERVPQCL